MGQAKSRGTFEERKAQAIARDRAAAEELKLERAREALRRRETPLRTQSTDRPRPRRRRIPLLSVAAMAALMAVDTRSSRDG